MTISRGNKCSVWCPSGAGAPAARPRDGLRTAAQVSLNLALVKNATLHGVFWGSYMQHQPRVLRASLEELLGWLGAGRISVPIFHRRAQPCITLTLYPTISLPASLDTPESAYSLPRGATRRAPAGPRCPTSTCAGVVFHHLRTRSGAGDANF